MFCKTFPVDALTAVPVEMTFQPDAYSVNQSAPGAQTMVERPLRQEHWITLQIPRCGTYSAWTKRRSGTYIRSSLVFTLILDWFFNAFYQLHDLWIYSLLSIFGTGFLIYFGARKRKRRSLGIPVPLNVSPKQARLHPAVLALQRKGWGVAPPQAYRRYLPAVSIGRR